jgi:hypothetical protein
LAYQAFLWNLSGSLHDPITLTFCVPAKLPSRGQHQCLLPVVPGPAWTTVAVALWVFNCYLKEIELSEMMQMFYAGAT